MTGVAKNEAGQTEKWVDPRWRICIFLSKEIRATDKMARIVSRRLQEAGLDCYDIVLPRNHPAVDVPQVQIECPDKDSADRIMLEIEEEVWPFMSDGLPCAVSRAK